MIRRSRRDVVPPAREKQRQLPEAERNCWTGLSLGKLVQIQKQTPANEHNYIERAHILTSTQGSYRFSFVRS